jgi:hypothetical protein
MANRGSPGDFAAALNMGREQGLLRSAHAWVVHEEWCIHSPGGSSRKLKTFGTRHTPTGGAMNFEKGTGSIYYADWQVHRAFPLQIRVKVQSRAWADGVTAVRRRRSTRPQCVE